MSYKFQIKYKFIQTNKGFYLFNFFLSKESKQITKYTTK